MPAAEVDVDLDLARRLLLSQHPGLMTEPLNMVGEGWDNVIVRVGEELAMRLPRREVAAALLRNEQRWLPEIAERLDVAVPAPVAIGEPSELFPWPWSVVRWLDGATADEEPIGGDQAAPLAATLRRLHVPAPPEAPVNPFRGVPLATREEGVRARLRRLNLPDLAESWQRALDAQLPGETVWIHGDLHPKNLLVRSGAIAGILDWGDLTAGDAATDLACGWMLFDAAARREFFDAYEASEAQQARAVGWAIHIATVMIDSGEPKHVALGKRIVRRIA